MAATCQLLAATTGPGQAASRKEPKMSTESAGAPVALVTGADKGIGLETARRLAGAGYRVYLTARSSERGQAAAATVGARFLELDVTSGESVRHAVGSFEQAEGHLDVLVNNAGITGPVRDPHDYTADDMTEVLLTNVVGYLRLIHAFLPLLEKSDDPRIVNVSSDLGSFRCFHDRIRTGANVGTPLYATSKAAVNMMTVHFASLLPKIRINAINPGLTATDLSGGQGHSVHDGTDAIVAYVLSAPGGPTGTFADRDGEVPW
jgi:NAD(P)-dependent dehydrogenase (short-subunit alcohol dehydrogenase family)